MARKITRKNFYMEIRRNFGRFISILFIVALGVAFFSGIRASEPSMRITGDAYFDESDLMDIKAVSTLGITKEDVSAVGNVKGVGKAEGAYSADFLNIKNKKQYVLHVMSAMEDMNKITVREGRMPEKAGECLVDDQMNYKIGETIKLKSGTDDKVTDTLKTDELKVVGKGNSPYYISLSRGSTTIGTGTISGFVVVPEKTFDLEMYLRYVVPSEMPSSYEKEALKAQAVCARTYACARIREKTWENYHADVDDSVESQVYHNMEAQPETDAAVAETEGKIITCGGEPIQAYFFSTSCGKTSTDEVWNTAETAEYLKSVTVGGEKQEPETEEAFASFITKRDSTSLEVEDGWYRWQVTIPADVLSERAADQKIGEITGIEVRRRSEGGAAETVRIEGEKGSMEIEGEYQIRKFLSAKGWPIQKNDGTVSCEMELLPSACFIVVPEKEGETAVSFTFYGGGYGHGVGMSQNGAKHLAEQGKSYEEILRYFYQNIEIGDCRSLF